ncbi:MAG: hypothetical protein PW786_03105 [Arachidicoccus sp.]|nr:hypothetical protein [Arachidicoccus sp.]
MTNRSIGWPTTSSTAWPRIRVQAGLTERKTPAPVDHHHQVAGIGPDAVRSPPLVLDVARLGEGAGRAIGHQGGQVFQALVAATVRVEAQHQGGGGLAAQAWNGNDQAFGRRDRPGAGRIVGARQGATPGPLLGLFQGPAPLQQVAGFLGRGAAHQAAQRVAHIGQGEGKVFGVGRQGVADPLQHGVAGDRPDQAFAQPSHRLQATLADHPLGLLGDHAHQALDGVPSRSGL